MNTDFGAASFNIYSVIECMNMQESFATITSQQVIIEGGLMH